MTETAIEKRTEQAPYTIPNATNMRIMATDLFNSRMFRGIENVPQAIAVIQFGSEIGIGPIQALTNIKPIQGQMTMSARLIMGMAAKAGVTWKVIEQTDKKCEIEFTRPGWTPIKASATIEEAARAGLVKSGSGWEKYPQDMLFKTAGTRGIRRIAPDATFGMYSTEEMSDAEPIAASVVSDQGENTPNLGPEGPQEPSPGHSEPSGPSFPENGPMDELSAIAARAEDEATGRAVSEEMELAIEGIKVLLHDSGVDERSFKEWLYGYQNSVRPVKAYVGKIGSSLRWHLGRENDVISLSNPENMVKAIKKFRGIFK